MQILFESWKPKDSLVYNFRAGSNKCNTADMEVSEHWWLEKENDAIHFVRVKDGVQSNKMKVIEIGSSPKLRWAC